MKNARVQSSARAGPPGELAELRARLAEAEDTLRAIRTGEVDALVVSGKQGDQVFTLEGAGHAYRVLIESMNEGALTLTTGEVILYANQCFARMVRLPLEQVTGGSFHRFLSARDRAVLRPLLKRPGEAGSKAQVSLMAGDDAKTPVQISIRPLEGNDAGHAAIGMVVTDMTEARRTEALLRALTHRVVQAQEAERGRVALELHDNITQLLCAVLIRSQTLADTLSTHDGPAKKEAVKLRGLLGEAAREVESISRDLRPSVLEHLGLAAVVSDTTRGFAERTGVPVKLACVELTARLPAASELALYRILQEALKNVERHARARHVSVGLRRRGASVELAIRDDGVGFDPEVQPAGRNGEVCLGLIGMKERANYVGGVVKVRSGPRGGTEIMARIPWQPEADG